MDETTTLPSSWWNEKDSGLTPEKLDILIDKVNQFNDLFGNLSKLQ